MVRFLKIFIFCFLSITPMVGHALSPIIQYQDLVAGTGMGGFEDGLFSSAQFNVPLGLSLNEDASILYVADQQNHRIRGIHFDQKNRVETIAGTGVSGNLDGPISIATFNYPAGVAVIPGGQIVVNDAGNHLLRLINLTTKKVSTLAGGKSGNEGDALNVSFSSIWSIVYFPLDNCLYFSQPENGFLSKLDLKTHQVAIVLNRDSLVPQPGALCVLNNRLYVADLKLPQVYEIHLNSEKIQAHPTQMMTSISVAGASKPVSLELVGQGQNILALAGSGENLYACQADKAPVYRIFPKAAPVTFTSVWGWSMTYPGSLFPEFGFADGDQVGFIPDPNSERRFYLANPHNSSIYAFRDLGFYQDEIDDGENHGNDMGLHDLSYPLAKPPKTFRILLIGRSYLFWQADERQFQQKGFDGENTNLLTTLAKKMELELNTRAALEDAPSRFEVLNGGMHHSLFNEFNVWSYYVVPDLVKKYDIDLVIIMQDSGISVQSFYNFPFTSEGIPGDKLDPEYALKPLNERFATEPMHGFFQVLKAQKLLGGSPEGGPWGFDIDKVILNPIGEKALVGLMGRSLKLLQRKVEATTTSGGVPCRLEFCYFPVWPPSRNPKDRRIFWSDLCREDKIPFMDLDDDFNALGTTYYPYAGPGMGHLTSNGMSLFSTIMVHELISNHKIPFSSAKP